MEKIASSKGLEVESSFCCTQCVVSTYRLLRTHYFVLSEFRETVAQVFFFLFFSFCARTCHSCAHQHCWWKPVRKVLCAKAAHDCHPLFLLSKKKAHHLKSSCAVYKQVYIPRGLHVLHRYIMHACVHVCCIYFFCLQMCECLMCVLVIDVSTFFYRTLT